MRHRIICFALFVLSASSIPVRADSINVTSFEYLDVLETTDGSIWKGVVVEQTPNVQYKLASSDGSVHVIKAADVVKLTKERNPQFHVATVASSDRAAVDGGSTLPAPYAHTGLRVDGELDFVFPKGTLGDIGVLTSFAPTLRLGYETMLGNFGITGGFQGRFTSWRLPGMTDDSAWLLETQLYGRAALHIGRAAPYVGASLGLDTNSIYDARSGISVTSLGFGMNVQFGLAIAATPALALEVGADYHPATDVLSDASHTSAEYFAMRLGTAIRF